MYLDADCADAIAVIAVPGVGAPRDCECVRTLRICTKAWCPRRALTPAFANDQQVIEDVA